MFELLTNLIMMKTASFIEQSCMIVDDEFDPSRKCEWIQMKPRAWHHLDEIFAGTVIL